MNTYLLGFSTSNYDAMIKFLKDFGFTVNEKTQLTRYLEEGQGRGAWVTKGDLEFNLEESTSDEKRACFNLALDYSDEDIERLKALGYHCVCEPSFAGEYYEFRSPDGGIIMLQ